MSRRHGFAFVLPALICLLLSATPLLAHGGNDDPQMIHACVHSGNSSVRIVAAAESCRAREIALHWAVGTPDPLDPDAQDEARVVVDGLTIEIEGLGAFSFAEVGGLGATVDVVEYRDGSGRTRRLPGQIHYTPLKVFTCPDDPASSIRDWFRRTWEGAVERRDVDLFIRDASGAVLLHLRYVRSLPFRADWDPLGEVITYLALQPERIEVIPPPTPGDPSPDRWVVELEGAGTSHALSIAGGEQELELVPYTSGSGGETVLVPGELMVNPLVLSQLEPTGAIIDWIRDVASPTEAAYRTVAVSFDTGSSVTLFGTYVDAFPTRINFLNPLAVVPGEPLEIGFDLTLQVDHVIVP